MAKGVLQSVLHRASGDPGSKRVRIPPHRGTRAEKVLLEHEGVGEDVGSRVREATA